MNHPVAFARSPAFLISFYTNEKVPHHPGSPYSPGVCGEELEVVAGGHGDVHRCERRDDIRISRTAVRLARRLVGAFHVVGVSSLARPLASQDGSAHVRVLCVQ